MYLQQLYYTAPYVFGDLSLRKEATRDPPLQPSPQQQMGHRAESWYNSNYQLESSSETQVSQCHHEESLQQLSLTISVPEVSYGCSRTGMMDAHQVSMFESSRFYEQQGPSVAVDVGMPRASVSRNLLVVESSQSIGSKIGGSRSISGSGEHGRDDGCEHSRMKKLGCMSWCRRCKIDCITMEGLVLHSQTKEHQNLTMALIHSIKRNIQLTTSYVDDKSGHCFPYLKEATVPTLLDLLFVISKSSFKCLARGKVNSSVESNGEEPQESSGDLESLRNKNVTVEVKANSNSRVLTTMAVNELATSGVKVILAEVVDTSPSLQQPTIREAWIPVEDFIESSDKNASNDENEAYSNIVGQDWEAEDKQLNVSCCKLLMNEELVLMDKALMKRVMQIWYPVDDSLLEIMLFHLPSPSMAQRYCVEKLFEGPIDDFYTDAIRNHDPEGSLMLYVSNCKEAICNLPKNFGEEWRRVWNPGILYQVSGQFETSNVYMVDADQGSNGEATALQTSLVVTNQNIQDPMLSSSPAMAFFAASAFPYAGFLFGASFPLTSTSFFDGSTAYNDTSTGAGEREILECEALRRVWDPGINF